jgi:hypothetical protein
VAVCLVAYFLHLCEILVIAVIQHIRRSAAGRVTERPAEEDDLISKIPGMWLLGVITPVITVGAAQESDNLPEVAVSQRRGLWLA